MSTDKTTENHDAGPLLGLGLSEGLGVLSPAKQAIFDAGAAAERERCINLLLAVATAKDAPAGSWENKATIKGAARRFAMLLANERPDKCTCAKFPLSRHEPSCGLQVYWDSLPDDE